MHEKVKRTMIDLDTGSMNLECRQNTICTYLRNKRWTIGFLVGLWGPVYGLNVARFVRYSGAFVVQPQVEL